MSKHKSNRGHDRKSEGPVSSYTIDDKELNTPEKKEAYSLFVANNCNMDKVISKYRKYFPEWKECGFLKLMQAYNTSGKSVIGNKQKKIK